MVAPAGAMDHPRVTPGLTADVLAVLHRHGIEWADGDNARRTDVADALETLVVAVAGRKAADERGVRNPSTVPEDYEW